MEDKRVVPAPIANIYGPITVSPGVKNALVREEHIWNGRSSVRSSSYKSKLSNRNK